MKKLTMLSMLVLAAAILISSVADRATAQTDPYEMLEAFERFPFARVIPLDSGNAWGIIYADVYGKVYLKRWTGNGWKREWELTNLGAKVRKFFIKDVEGDGKPEIVIATVTGRILIYSMENFVNVWENIEADFKSLEAIAVENIDNDPQAEFILIADKIMYIIDSKDKSRQWISEREFTASEIVVANMDNDDQLEIVLNTGIVIDSKFHNIELEWEKSFGDRIIVFDMNNDGHPEVIGEFSDYSLRIFDVYSEREVW